MNYNHEKGPKRVNFVGIRQKKIWTGLGYATLRRSMSIQYIYLDIVYEMFMQELDSQLNRTRPHKIKKQKYYSMFPDVDKIGIYSYGSCAPL